jgi:hypothetical protein
MNNQPIDWAALANEGVHGDFTYPCRVCGEAVQVTGGRRDPQHPCQEEESDDD